MEHITLGTTVVTSICTAIIAFLGWKQFQSSAKKLACVVHTSNFHFPDSLESVIREINSSGYRYDSDYKISDSALKNIEHFDDEYSLKMLVRLARPMSKLWEQISKLDSYSCTGQFSEVTLENKGKSDALDIAVEIPYSAHIELEDEEGWKVIENRVELSRLRPNETRTIRAWHGYTYSKPIHVVYSDGAAAMVFHKSAAENDLYKIRAWGFLEKLSNWGLLIVAIWIIVKYIPWAK